MNEEILQEAGLTKVEARIYTILVKNSPCTPPKLADLAGESRTNTYKLLDSLETIGLVNRDETEPKLRYWANNPSVLLDMLKNRRSLVEQAEKRFQSALPKLTDEYFKHSEQPSIRYFYGAEGVLKVYDDQLKTGEPLTLIHAPGLVDTIGKQNSHLLRNKFPKHGISQHMFYTDTEPYTQPGEPSMPIEESDKIMKMTRTWLKEGDLEKPVEWTVYGNKLSIVSLDIELVGMIIESPQIAASFREILDLLDRKIRLEPGYDKLPIKRTRTMIPESVKKQS